MKIRNILTYATIVCAIALNSCDISNIGKDDNGDDIPLVRMDLPKFGATYMFNFVDESDNLINSPITVKFSGMKLNGKSYPQLLVTDGCKVNQSYDVTNGMLSLNLNPNRTLADTIKFTANASGPQAIGISKFIKQTFGLAKSVRIEMINIQTTSSNKNKQARSGSFSGVNVDKGEVVATLEGRSNGNGYDYVALMRGDESGEYTVTSTDDNIADYGIYELNADMSKAPSRSRAISSGEYFFVVKKKAGLVEGRVNLKVSSATIAATSFGYEISTANGIYVGVISGILPITAAVEQIFVPLSNKAVSVKIIPVAPYQTSEATKSITDITVPSGANVPEFNLAINSASNLKMYNFNLLGYCKSDKKITYAVTKDFQYSKGSKNSTENRVWNTGQFSSGKSAIFMEENQMYTFRICINSKWYSYDITTDMDKVADVLAKESEYITKYSIVKASNSNYTINIDVTADELCDITK